MQPTITQATLDLLNAAKADETKADDDHTAFLAAQTAATTAQAAALASAQTANTSAHAAIDAVVAELGITLTPATPTPAPPS